jgi:hypothetical protein
MLGILFVRSAALRVGRWLLLAAVLFNNYYLGALSVVAPLVAVAKGRKHRQGQTVGHPAATNCTNASEAEKIAFLHQPIFEIRACHC